MAAVYKCTYIYISTYKMCRGRDDSIFYVYEHLNAGRYKVADEGGDDELHYVIKCSGINKVAAGHAPAASVTGSPLNILIMCQRLVSPGEFIHILSFSAALVTHAMNKTDNQGYKLWMRPLCNSS